MSLHSQQNCRKLEQRQCINRDRQKGLCTGNMVQQLNMAPCMSLCHVLQDGNSSSSGDEVEDDSAEDEDEVEVEAGDDYLIAKVGAHRLQRCLLARRQRMHLPSAAGVSQRVPGVSQ